MSSGNLIFMRKQILTFVCLLAATPAWSEVLLRWTESSIPAAATMGLNELIVSWDAEGLIRTARRQGYRVYVEIPVGKAADMVRSTMKGDLAGIVINPANSEPGQVNEDLRQLRSAYPGLPVLVVSVKAKQPQMRGQLVIKRDGILQVTSPTAQPWIDSNLALVRLNQAFFPAQTPFYELQWDLSDSQQQEYGPNAADYSLAIAEAGAFQSDLILDLHPKLQSDLSRNVPAAWAVMNQIKRYLAFASRGTKNSGKPEANVGVITASYDEPYEPVNLFARHNIPFKVLKASDLKPQSLEAFDLLVVFFAAEESEVAAISEFASKGGIVVVVTTHGHYPWQSGQSIPAGENSVAYTVGRGRIIELQGPVTDPETFAQDIRRLLDKDKLAISLWNALTVVAVPYYAASGRMKFVEFVNYSQDPIPVQVQVKGWFSSILYETPDRVCCESLTSVQRGAFTEFVLPSLRIAGRVHLESGKPSKLK